MRGGGGSAAGVAARRVCGFATAPRVATVLLTLTALIAWPLSLAFAEPARSGRSMRTANHAAPANPVGRQEIRGASELPPPARPFAHAGSARAHAANVNSVLPKFDLNFIYGTRITGPPTARPGQTLRAPPGNILLQGVYLFPFYPSNESIFGGCSGCTGTGHFLPSHVGSINGFARAFHHKASDFRCSRTKHFVGCIPPPFLDNTYSSVVRGKRIIGPKTRFIEATLGAEIGRFSVYGLDVKNHKLHSVKQGCTPAYLDLGVKVPVVTRFLLTHVNDLPTVPCRQRIPPGSRVAIRNLPLEFSSNSSVHGQIRVHASTSEWAIAFQEPASSIGRGQPACLPNALAEVSRTTVLSELHVHPGTTTINYSSAPARSPGFTCVYLQVGGRLNHPGVKLPLPDGRVVATTSQVFLAGDTVRISAPTTAARGQTVQFRVTGSASINQELYVFAPYSACAGSAQDEYRADTHVFTKALKRGSFNVPITLKVPQNAPPTVNLCAYLQTGRPTAGGAPNGSTTAVDSAEISIS